MIEHTHKVCMTGEGMKQECSPIPVPYHLREQFVNGDDFIPQMRERGWSVASARPVYSDPEVIRQPWLVCPTGARYADRAFYHLFGITRFRKLLRTLLARGSCSKMLFTSICPDVSELETYLAFLRDQELLHKEGQTYRRGVRLFTIKDIGHTLEWYVAEWFRVTQTHTYLIRARHGVTFHRSLDIGDIDVVALLDPWIITVECKSASHISDLELSLFLRRTNLLQPAIAVLLIDSASMTLAGPLRRLNQLLLAEPVRKQLAPLSPLQGVWGTTSLYVTSVSQSLNVSLTSVLQAIERNEGKQAQGTQ